jgi:hypothetical protein
VRGPATDGTPGRAPPWIPAFLATAADCLAPSSPEFRRVYGAVR